MEHEQLAVPIPLKKNDSPIPGSHYVPSPQLGVGPQELLACL